MVKSQSSCFSALQRYIIFGAEMIKNSTLSNEGILALTSDELLAKVREIYSYGHEISYYGPLSEKDLRAVLAEKHFINENAVALEEKHVTSMPVQDPAVLLAQYDAKQLYYMQYSCKDEAFDASKEASIDLYNEYFGGGMNSVVFQEMREARGLAYSAWARMRKPAYIDDSYYYMAFIATQNDKMKIAIDAFDDIINNMPQSEAAFSIAKEGFISRLRTDRTTKMGVLSSYKACRRLGLKEPLDKEVFEAVQNMTLEDVIAYQQQNVLGRSYQYGILGDIKDLDMNYLRQLGPVKVLSQKDIFGF